MNLIHPLPISILTVDDHPLFQQGIASVINIEPDLYLVGQAASGAEAVALYRQTRPAVTLMDLQLPDMSGIDAITAIRAEFPAARIVVLTTLEGDVHATRAIKAGAVGFIYKSTVRKNLIDTLRSVHAGGRCIPPSLVYALAETRNGNAITAREVDVLKLAARGNSNPMIAAALGLSSETVKGYMSSILLKLEARDRTHAVMIALERGILSL
ncbi:two component transcriptional regulator, LuxR family [Duganella sp. CF402]|uniref:response regulator n=1 Tax=unclassified Duganella TaxID=2636909 RepID=UPI0008C3F16B|nr:MULTISPECIES: response regulator transcription factor [unclassified Duganella]RZT10199.1 LuxR family two component transcriptional regulator [Duganella sp. BK701]SEL23715.1 two component transcriptional regulator, LuxR family [Duganella sp. CF402]